MIQTVYDILNFMTGDNRRNPVFALEMIQTASASQGKRRVQAVAIQYSPWR